MTILTLWSNISCIVLTFTIHVYCNRARGNCKKSAFRVHKQDGYFVQTNFSLIINPPRPAKSYFYICLKIIIFFVFLNFNVLLTFCEDLYCTELAWGKGVHVFFNSRSHSAPLQGPRGSGLGPLKRSAIRALWPEKTQFE